VAFGVAPVFSRLAPSLAGLIVSPALGMSAHGGQSAQFRPLEPFSQVAPPLAGWVASPGPETPGEMARGFQPAQF
jgi:hypothetical protein